MLYVKENGIQVDRQAWIQENFIIHNEELYILSQYKRRTMYSKQLAKFSSDLGSTHFSVDKRICISLHLVK